MFITDCILENVSNLDMMMPQLWAQVCQVEFLGYVPFRSEDAVFEPKMAFFGQNLGFYQ